jgi:hypothetical protein
VYDPKRAEFLFIDGPRLFKYALHSGGKGGRKGYGDCDDITAAAGALLRSIGMDTMIATLSPPFSPYIFTHVFLMVKPPKAKRWVAFDPVVYPKHGFGYITPWERLALWDLRGKLLYKNGKFPPKFDQVMALYGPGPGRCVGTNLTGQIGDDTMPMTREAPSYFDFEDQSDRLGLFGEADKIDDQNAAAMNALRDNRVLADFTTDGILGFGCYSGIMGITTGDKTPYIMAEYDESDMLGDTGLVRTKHFEMAPDDYAVLMRQGVPNVGTLAMSDDGDIYQWEAHPEGIGGWFKKLARRVKKGFRRIKKGVKKGIRWVGKKVKKFIRKTRFGRILWKVGSKIWNTAMKVVKPLMRYLGPIAKRIAPIAAFVPGIGPAVSGALMLTGKVADIAKKVGISFDRKGKPQPKNKEQARRFARALAAQGRRLGKRKAASILARYRRKKGLSGYGGLGATFSDANVNSYYLTPDHDRANVGWF